MVFDDIFHMQQMILDQDDQKKLEKAFVVVAGIGGIGTFVVELLARNGVGNFRLADFDKFDPTNARQLFMTQATVGKHKAEAAAERILSINPNIDVDVYKEGKLP